MKKLNLLIVILLAINLISVQGQILDEVQPDSTTVDQEMFIVQQRVIIGSAFTAAGVGMITVGRAILYDKIDTTILSDNLFFPGYVFVGIGIASYVNAWLHFRKVQFMVNQNGAGLVLTI